MFHFSRKALKQEALGSAAQNLETTVQRIDNILLSVEQASGNIYWKIVRHLDQPDKIEEYRRMLVERNPYISNCVITIDSTVTASMPHWTEPEKQGKGEAFTSFRLPLYNSQKVIGELAVDVPLTLLSKIMQESHPTSESYCTLLGSDGSFIVHPDSNKLHYQNVFHQLGLKDSTVTRAARSMVSGETGYMRVNINGDDYYVFYKPFERNAVPGRSMGKLGWSIGVVYSENAIFGDYNRLLYTTLITAIIGLCLLLVFCQRFIHRQLRPLRLLTNSAQQIADGHYDKPIPDSRQIDEVGRLQKHFQQMQQSLATNMGKMEQLTATLEERGAALQATYEQAQAADRMKTSFLYNMTNQMMMPVSSICRNVKTISKHFSELSEEDSTKLVDEITAKGEKITALLNELIANSEKQTK